MIHRHSFIWVPCLLLGCGGPSKPPAQTAATQPQPAQVQQPAQPQQAPPPVSNQPVKVDLQVEAITKQGQHMVSPGETLHSGDRMALRVEVDQPAYVYVAQASVDGSSAVLYPRSGDEQFKPGNPVRIPTVGQWFRLDKDTGQEDLFVYAAKQPISQPDLQARLKADVGAARAADAKKTPTDKPKKHRRSAPGGLTSGSRGMELDEGPGGAEVQTDPSGVSSVHFSIQHAR